MGLFSNYYMYIVHKDNNILHLRRSPTWKSLLIFLSELKIKTHYFIKNTFLHALIKNKPLMSGCYLSFRKREIMINHRVLGPRSSNRQNDTKVLDTLIPHLKFLVLNNVHVSIVILILIYCEHMHYAYVYQYCTQYHQY